MFTMLSYYLTVKADVIYDCNEATKIKCPFVYDTSLCTCHMHGFFASRPEDACSKLGT